MPKKCKDSCIPKLMPTQVYLEGDAWLIWYCDVCGHAVLQRPMDGGKPRGGEPVPAQKRMAL